ncbi:MULTISPECIES: amino acid ABC transporter permease [Actinomadura]|uniref:amino acid ABC transporter permease n=1 Tax=Actinomadura TaxID=1988 RepID=UPI000463362B|nr:amino acid ABC transporter permease [Actinomadura madurae]
MTGGVWEAVAQGIVATIQLTVLGFAIGAVLGIPLLVLRVAPFWALRATARAFIEVSRGVPLLIWLFLIYNGTTQFDPALGAVFTPSRSAILAIGLVSAAYMAEIYRGSLRAINQGQFEASRALGMSQLDTASRIVGPQMIRVAIPASASYAIGLLKDSSLASTIGVFEMTYYASTASSNTSSVTPFFVAGAYYVALTFPSAWAARRLEWRMRRRVAW